MFPSILRTPPRTGPPLRRRSLAGALAAVAVATGIAVAPAAPAAADPTAPPLGSDVTFASTPTFDPLGNFGVSRGLDGTVLFAFRTLSNDSFGPFVSLGFPLVGDPTAVNAAQGVQVFWRSPSNTAMTSLVIGSQGFAQEIPGLAISSEIAAVGLLARGPQPPMTRIFARGLDDGAVYTNLLINGDPQGWVRLGGFTSSEIAAAVTGPNDPTVNIRLVVRGGDNRLFSMIFNNTNGIVSDWAPLGDLIATGNPTLSGNAAALNFPQGNQVAVLSRVNGSFNNSLNVWDFNNPRWVNLGGNYLGDVGVGVQSDFGLNLYTRGTNNRIFVTRRPPGTFIFRGTENLGGRATSNIVATGGDFGLNQRPLVDQFFTRSLENLMHGRTVRVSGAGYGGFFYLGGPLHG